MRKNRAIGPYLIREIYKRGIRHVFGVPGDYVLGFYDLLQKSPIQVIGTTTEAGAGFAADAYARVQGIGCVCVTYCVGGLNLTNPIAGAYAEKSPVIVISGGPGMKEREKDLLLHHRVREFTTQKEVFEKITVASTILDDPLTAPSEIHRVLTAVERFKRPVYIELPRDRVFSPIDEQRRMKIPKAKSDPQVLKAAVAEAVEMLNRSKRPVILAGVEVHRFGLQNELIQLAEKTRIPVAADLLGKSVIRESHPYYLGIYEGAIGREAVRRAVESSDSLLMLGCFLTDINLGIYTARLDPVQAIYATSEKISIHRHRYDDLLFPDFVRALVRSKIRRRPAPKIPSCKISYPHLQGENARLKIQRLFQHLNTLLTDDMVVIADIGDALFGAADLTIHKRTEFLSPAYYTGMGFSIPAALGTQVARANRRPVVIVGDGAFQMTGMELSTIAKCGLNPIILVLNNRSYGTEELIHPGPFNQIPDWHYHKLPEILGAGEGFDIYTENDFKESFHAAWDRKDCFSILNIHIDPHDHSPAMERLAKRLSKKA